MAPSAPPPSDIRPKITVVTPSFNQGDFIAQTIHSVLDQGYPNIEYIIVDGGSTDASVQIIEKNQTKLAHWVSERDRGQTHAINKGMAHATGDILSYLNSDDYYLPGTFNAIADAFGRNPDADLFVGRCRYVDVDGSTIGGHFGEISNYEEILDLWGTWWNGRQFVQPEVFWTRRIAEKIGPFTEHLNFVMDYDYWARIFREGGKVVRIDRELTAFRFTPDQKSNQSKAVSDELLELVRPWIWDPASPVSTQVRQRLKAAWQYHAGFLKLRDQKVSQGCGRSERILALAKFLATHPRVVVSEQFRGMILDNLRMRAAKA